MCVCVCVCVYVCVCVRERECTWCSVVVVVVVCVYVCMCVCLHVFSIPADMRDIFSNGYNPSAIQRDHCLGFGLSEVLVSLSQHMAPSSEHHERSKDCLAVQRCLWSTALSLLNGTLSVRASLPLQHNTRAYHLVIAI